TPRPKALVMSVVMSMVVMSVSSGGWVAGGGWWEGGKNEKGRRVRNPAASREVIVTLVTS
ncbi:MAG: hypothetical protein MUE78_03940, partial [Ilumatobacteraceae bacterium]|nr:hypothetical protein [Ilumatobacteraceae bacterium]